MISIKVTFSQGYKMLLYRKAGKAGGGDQNFCKLVTLKKPGSELNPSPSCQKHAILSVPLEKMDVMTPSAEKFLISFWCIFCFSPPSIF